jgi:hypothetical protein
MCVFGKGIEIMDYTEAWHDSAVKNTTFYFYATNHSGTAIRAVSVETDPFAHKLAETVMYKGNSISPAMKRSHTYYSIDGRFKGEEVMLFTNTYLEGFQRDAGAANFQSSTMYFYTPQQGGSVYWYANNLGNVKYDSKMA